MWHQKAKGPPDGPPIFLIFVEKLNCPQSQAYQSISPVGTGLSLTDRALEVSLGTSIGNYSPLIAPQPVKLKIKKGILFVAIACIVPLAGIEFFCMNQNSINNWQPITSIKEYSQLFDQPITKITLRETVDSGEWVVFEDEDLIEKWTNFLKNMKVKREWVFLDPTPMNGGGGMIANIETRDSMFVICLQEESDGYQLETSDYLYTIKNDIQIPFRETFDIAAERHGIQFPWD